MLYLLSQVLERSAERFPEREAFRFDGKPIYCTQFHPELNRDDLVLRLSAYEDYLSLTGHASLEEFAAHTADTPETEAILRRFMEAVGLT